MTEIFRLLENVLFCLVLLLKVIDPFVSVSVYGIPADTAQEKTRTITNNGN